MNVIWRGVSVGNALPPPPLPAITYVTNSGEIIIYYTYHRLRLNYTFTTVQLLKISEL